MTNKEYIMLRSKEPSDPLLGELLDSYDALKALLPIIDRILFNKPTRADYATIEAAHKLVKGYLAA